VIDAIYFNQRELLADRIKAAYQLQSNEYNGTKKVQLSLRYVVI
jgi:single-stranded-DNA-specific exonuclease